MFDVTLSDDGTGSFKFTLHDNLDHAPGASENDIALQFNFTATDSDGDSANGTFAVGVDDDIPVIDARAPDQTTITNTETTDYTLQAGNTDVRGMDGNNNHDIKLTAIDLSDSGNDSVNTNNDKIGVGDQWIDGHDTHPNDTGPEILSMQFVNNLQITGNQNPTITDGGSYDVSSAKFSINVAEDHQIETAVVFVSATNNGNFVALTFDVTGSSPFTVTSVYDSSGNQIGYVLNGVSDQSTIEVTGAAFDTLKVGNYNDYSFFDTSSHHQTSFDGGNSFQVFGIESSITTTTIVTETFKVSEDESAGINTMPDPNLANDVNPVVDVPPSEISGAFGYAKSPTSVLASGSLFAGKVGADGPGTYAFAITDKNGATLNGVDSGLKALDGSHILLSTDASGAVVGSVGQTTVFKVYVDGNGFVWIAQYQAIAHDLDGSSAAAFDDIATVTADLHVKATLTDSDGDSVSAVSGVALQVQFQDDGPTCHCARRYVVGRWRESAERPES